MPSILDYYEFASLTSASYVDFPNARNGVRHEWHLLNAK